MNIYLPILFIENMCGAAQWTSRRRQRWAPIVGCRRLWTWTFILCLKIFESLNKGAALVEADRGNKHDWARKNLRNWDISHRWQWVSHLFFCSLILAALGRNKWSTEIIITLTFNTWYSECKDLSAKKWFWWNFSDYQVFCKYCHLS